MKIYNLKTRTIKITEAENWEDEDYYDFYDDGPNTRYGKLGRDFFEDPEKIDDEDEKDNLGYQIRKVLSIYGINCQVEFEDDYGLCVRIYLKRKEKMGDILKYFDVVVNKVKNQILTQYESEVELYETTKGQPVLEFSFYVSSSSESPF